jgi:hypothetical protein
VEPPLAENFGVLPARGQSNVKCNDVLRESQNLVVYATFMHGRR